MAEVFIIPRNHTGGDGDDFVGMRFDSKEGKPFVEAIFPLGYNYTSIGDDGRPINFKDKSNQDALKKELYNLLYIINRYGKSGDGALEGAEACITDFPFDAYFTMIKHFMQYGYYIESEVRYKNSPMGKINWKRTISQIKPHIQDNSAVYTEFIIRQTQKKNDKLISLIHEWCVYEAFTKLGWLFTSFKPHKPLLKIGKDEKERDYFVLVILESFKATFNDRNKMLFSAMIAMLKHKQAEKKNAFSYGTTNFKRVWENLIDTSYGVTGTEKKEFFPPAEWLIIGSSKPKVNNLFPDTILRLDKDNKKIYVLDAKYYGYVDNTNRLPAAADIHKQVVYGEYAANKHNIENVYNAFLIPYDFLRNPHSLDLEKNAKYAYIGFSRMVGKSSELHERVLGILIDTKWLIQNVGRINKEHLANFIEQKHADAAPVK